MQTEELVNNAHAVAKDHTAEKSVQQKMLYVTDVNESDIFVHANQTSFRYLTRGSVRHHTVTDK